MADSTGDGGGGEGGKPVCVFKKPVFKKKGGAAKQQNKRARKQASDSGSGSSGDDEEESVLLRKQQAKGSKAGATATAAKTSVLHTYASSGSAAPAPVAGGATYTSEIDTEHDRDNRALLEMAIKVQREEEEEAVGLGGEKIYRGQAGYRNYVPKNEAQIGGNKYTGTQGPIRAPSYLRATAVFDYKPDICKDYKETGFCGFGDGCKFMHDRSDYKSGYELEQEWETQQKRKRQRDLGEWAGSEDEEEGDDAYLIKEDDDLPFACFLCREGFRDPVVTVCGHYFCSSCALQHHKTDPTCPACGEKTGGVFNFAVKLFEKMKKDEAKRKAVEEKDGQRAALGKETVAIAAAKRRKKKKEEEEAEGVEGEGEGEEEEGGEEGEEELVIQEEDKDTVVKKKKGTWSTL
ncbi:hypothetical protein VYU27_006842 [Nannochloropsis oceanica]